MVKSMAEKRNEGSLKDSAFEKRGREEGRFEEKMSRREKWGGAAPANPPLDVS